SRPCPLSMLAPTDFFQTRQHRVLLDGGRGLLLADLAVIVVLDGRAVLLALLEGDLARELAVGVEGLHLAVELALLVGRALAYPAALLVLDGLAVELVLHVVLALDHALVRGEVDAVAALLAALVLRLHDRQAVVAV